MVGSLNMLREATNLSPNLIPSMYNSLNKRREEEAEDAWPV